MQRWPLRFTLAVKAVFILFPVQILMSKASQQCRQEMKSVWLALLDGRNVQVRSCFQWRVFIHFNRVSQGGCHSGSQVVQCSLTETAGAIFFYTWWCFSFCGFVALRPKHSCTHTLHFVLCVHNHPTTYSYTRKQTKRCWLVGHFLRKQVCCPRKSEAYLRAAGFVLSLAEMSAWQWCFQSQLSWWGKSQSFKLCLATQELLCSLLPLRWDTGQPCTQTGVCCSLLLFKEDFLRGVYRKFVNAPYLAAMIFFSLIDQQSLGKWGEECEAGHE